jgi:uncharacterized radical SAM protein YgiQ
MSQDKRHTDHRIKGQWLPTTRKEMEHLGWEQADVILFTGDAYIDHPSMGCAVIGRVLEAHGYKVAIVPQPNWRDDLRDFKKLGRPRLYFGVSAGAMDSMVNHYTAARRKRSDDAYTPDGRAGARPDYPTIVYSEILKRLFPDVPVVAGGIEVSLRRLAHYDYWQDRLRPSILIDCPADMLVYGMGELPNIAIADALAAGKSIEELTDIPQTVVRRPLSELPTANSETDVVLHSYKECQQSMKAQAQNFKVIEVESNLWHGHNVWQATGDIAVKVNRTNPPMTTEQIDASFDLPYTRLPHPRYQGKRIPAYEMIRFSVCMHRGCFGGCSFCTISAHQGKQITSRSKQSILRQIERIKDLPEWRGNLSDLGGPSANMYAMHGRDMSLCERCARASCLQPNICKNLNQDFGPLLDIYRTVDRLPYIKRAYVGSGVRYDLMSEEYGRQLITRHVSGRLKVAPEHTAPDVLRLMRKPSWEHFMQFRDFFLRVNEENGLHQQLIPYFISSHPGCTNRDMSHLAEWTKKMHYHPEQVQDFTPTPMTLSTTMFYTGLNPYTMKPVFVARTKEQKERQRAYFFWWKQDKNQRL